MFCISDHHGDWQILIGAPQEIAKTSEYNDLSLVIFDNADITAQSKLLHKFATQSPNCQIVGLSSSSNFVWKQNLKSILHPNEICVAVSDPFFHLKHRFAVCDSFTQKIDIVVAICDNLKAKNKKAVLFAVSINSILIFTFCYKS